MVYEWSDIHRSLTSSAVSSLLHVGVYVVAVAVSLLLYYIAACMDPGYVPIVSQVLITLSCAVVAINL